MIYALIGNPNSGKTALFNQLTGSRQHVGNFPGVTVEKKMGVIQGYPEEVIVDLPGIYSLTPYSNEEMVTRNFLFNERVEAIINIVDATNLERNLYLSLQLLELNIPMVIALNMMDVIRHNGGFISVKELSNRFGVPIIPISATCNEGIDHLIYQVMKVAKEKLLPQKIDIYGEKIDGYACIATKRYQYIEKVVKDTVNKGKRNKARDRSFKIDALLTHRLLAVPFFIMIMFVIFYLSFSSIGMVFADRFSAFMDAGITMMSDFLLRLGVSSLVHSMVVDGALRGIGSVLSFLPIIVTLFFFLALLEDSGYMARVAFIMDKPLRNLGLNGRSFVSLFIGFGCSVPAIMSTRTLSNEYQRTLTIFLIPFVSCSAKLPIYSVFCYHFFKEKALFVMIIIYMLGIIIGIIVGLVGEGMFGKEKEDSFVMELPDYRLPSTKSIALFVWTKVKEFVTKAFTIIFISSMVIWFFQTFDFQLHVVSSPKDSLLAMLGQSLVPLFQPIGFYDWRIIAALMTGFSAKEAVVSTLAVLTNTTVESLGDALSHIFTPLSAFSFLVFCLLYTPCVAAISVVKKELHSFKKAFIMVAFQIGIAYFIAWFVYTLGCLLL